MNGGLYRGFWWAYFGGLAAGILMGSRDDWWFMVPVVVVAIMAFTRRVS